MPAKKSPTAKAPRRASAKKPKNSLRSSLLAKISRLPKAVSVAVIIFVFAAVGATLLNFSHAATTRASGLPWSSGIWAAGGVGNVNQYISSARGGVAVDNVMDYTTRDSQSAQINSIANFSNALPSGFNASRDDFVFSITTWTSDGAFTTGAQGAQMGTAICKIDPTGIVRLDWEMNLADGAGSNGAELNSGNFNAWVARFRAVATGIKSTCPGTRIDFNPNVGADQTSGCGGAVANWCTRRAFQQLKDVVDIFGIDTYDSWPPVTPSGSGWSTRLTNDGWLEESRKYAVANGKKFSVPEWGVACNVGGCQWQGNAGGDDPTYINDMMDYFNTHAADMAYETYFGDPNGYIISSLVSANPSSRAAMVAKVKQYKGTGVVTTPPVTTPVPPVTTPTSGTVLSATDNLSVGKTWTSTLADNSTETGYPIANLTDKNDGTRWISEPKDGGSITLNLGGTYN